MGLRPRSRWGSLSAPPDLLAVFKGLTSKGKEGEGEGKGKGRGRGEGQGKGVQGRGERPYPVANSWLGHCT